MSENEMLDRCLAALKKCQSEEEVKEALEDCELTDEELDMICGGILGLSSLNNYVSLGVGTNTIIFN